MTAEERLERLERQFEALEAQAQAPHEEVRAKRLVLEDNKGKIRAWLTVVKEQPMFVLCDENGKLRAALAASEDGSWLNLYDEKGKVLWQAP